MGKYIFCVIFLAATPKQTRKDVMASITQDMRFYLSRIKYAQRFGVTKAALKYKTNLQYIYAGRNAMMAPGTPSGTNPDALTITQISIYRKKSNSLRICAAEILMPVFWVKLRQRDCSRSISGLYRFLKKQGIMAVSPPNPKYIPKPYEKIDYPGFQVDLKFVPSACLRNSNVIGKQFFQYTAIDE